jgi:N utilization substance protein B
MQALYGYKQAENSDYELALDNIDDSFSSLEPQKAEGYRKLACLLFEESYLNERVVQGDMPDKVFKATVHAINFYRNQVAQDKKFFEKHLSSSLDIIYHEYLSVLALLPALGETARKLSEEKVKLLNTIQENRDESVLNDNTILTMLRNHSKLSVLWIRNGATWDKENIFVRTFYREVVRPDEAFQAYLKAPFSNFEDDKKLIDHIVRKLILKHTSIHDFFAEKDIYWTENQETIKSMVLKTIKSITEDGEMELSELSKSWEEDTEFYKNLYNFTLEEDRKQDAVIAEKIKNWDMDRVSLTDQIILKMAVAEMIHFSSIPVKVTINEYIELAKSFSTPKSKQFVNGMLDSLSQEMIAGKIIRKSGRGLLDNK